jgi:CheY-like chemotaxis protein/HPt (histidine-containing phosphotransfer) domain-containing protein
LAEDNVVSQRVAVAMLENLGFSVNVVADGAEAVRVATLVRFDAILMDCQIPVLDGFKATEEIRRLQGAGRRTPIIAVTASPGSDHLRCLDGGMDDYLCKPIRMEPLAAMLDRWVPGRPGVTGDADPTKSLRGPPDGLYLLTGSTPEVLDGNVLERLERLGKAAGEDLVAQLASLFLADADAKITAIRQALVADDPATVLESTHALSGASANLGATELARLCEALAAESLANVGSTSGLLAAVETELGHVRAALVSLRPTS